MVSLKRIFFIAPFLVVAHSAVSQDAAPIEVADDVYSYGGPTGYVSMFVVTDDGVIAIDPINTPHSQGLVAAIKSVTDQPIRYLVHSHNHWDHSGGGQVFRDEGTTIIAHVDAYEWMRANPHPDMVVPDESWGGSRKDIVLGGMTVELHHFGMSHGRGMTVPLASAQRVAYIADVVAPNRLPFMFLPDFNVKDLERTLGQILTLDIDKVIFTHSANPDPLQGGTKQDVADTLQYLSDLRAGIDAEIEKGTPPGMVPATVRLPKYENWAMYDEWLSLNAWKIWLEGYLGPF
ncbi:MAG: MBL fold metallo-hydrolase [Acidobacteria bacterium]|nr:MBL fold metallo-hydrolase [Acidobacteriota bacterium]